MKTNSKRTMIALSAAVASVLVAGVYVLGSKQYARLDISLVPAASAQESNPTEDIYPIGRVPAAIVDGQ